MLSEWQPIESAPKDGSFIIGWHWDWQRPIILRWKTNHRIVAAHQENQSRDLAESYFGDPDEYDDYELAIKGKGATLWMPLPEPPLLKPSEKGKK